MKRKEKQIMEIEARIAHQPLTEVNRAILITIDLYLESDDALERNKYWSVIRSLAISVFPEVFRRGRK